MCLFVHVVGANYVRHIKSSDNFTSFTFTNDVIAAQCVCLCVCVCLLGEQGVGTVWRASTCIFTPKADSYPYITQTHPHVLASFLSCLLVFFFHQLGSGGCQGGGTVWKEMHHWLAHMSDTWGKASGESQFNMKLDLLKLFFAQRLNKVVGFSL